MGKPGGKRNQERLWEVLVLELNIGSGPRNKNHDNPKKDRQEVRRHSELGGNWQALHKPPQFKKGLICWVPTSLDSVAKMKERR